MRMIKVRQSGAWFREFWVKNPEKIKLYETLQNQKGMYIDTKIIKDIQK